MTVYKKRPPIEPVFSARQYDGRNAESFLTFLQSGATCTTTNKGYGQLSHEIRLMTDGESVQITKGDWVVYSEDQDAKVMSDEEFQRIYEPEVSPVEPSISAEMIERTVDGYLKTYFPSITIPDKGSDRK